MLSVHRFYEAENKQLNKALSKKAKRIKELEKLLKEIQDKNFVKDD